MVSPSEPYQPRYIRFLELWQLDGWKLKAYGISREVAGPPDALYVAAWKLASECLPRPAVTGDRYGVGFVGIHAGRAGNLVFVDWWGDENELHHHVARSEVDSPALLRPASEADLTFCVWDVALICFERSAWVATVLGAAEPSLERYLETRYQALV